MSSGGSAILAAYVTSHNAADQSTESPAIEPANFSSVDAAYLTAYALSEWSTIIAAIRTALESTHLAPVNTAVYAA